MKKIVLPIVMGAAVAVLAGSLARAQTPQAPPKPGPEHKRLGYFVGKWTSEGEMKASPMGPAGKITGSDTCEWFEGGYSVVCHSEGKTPMGTMKSIGIMGYSTEEKVYTYYGVDSSPMTMASVAKGTIQGNTWTYNDEGTMGGQKMKMRVTLTEESPTAYTFKMEMAGSDGKWMPLMESKSTKTK
jgi:uncharacterized protein DUF1579